MKSATKMIALALAIAAPFAATPALAGTQTVVNEAKSQPKGVCKHLTKSKTALVAGAATTAATAGAAANAAGFAAVAHSSGAVILTSVGAGGTGYIAGTLGSMGAVALGIASAPAVIIGGTIVAVGAGGTYAYCNLRK